MHFHQESPAVKIRKISYNYCDAIFISWSSHLYDITIQKLITKLFQTKWNVLTVIWHKFHNKYNFLIEDIIFYLHLTFFAKNPHFFWVPIYTFCLISLFLFDKCLYYKDVISRSERGKTCLTLFYIISQNGQTRFKNLAVFTAVQDS